jgi:hypothetical protein
MNKVKVYYNLHKHCFSVVSLEKENYGRVILHTQEITLTNAKFKVSQAGRERVLREGRKNVHAFVVGYVSAEFPSPNIDTEITYNPYKYASFVEKATEKEVGSAYAVKLSHRKIFAKL